MKKQRILAIMIMVGVLFSVTLNAQEKLKGKAKKNFRSAKMYMKQKNFEKSIPLFEEVITERPDYISAYEMIGDIYISQTIEDYKKNDTDYDSLDEYYSSRNLLIENFISARKYYLAAIKAEVPGKNKKTEKLLAKIKKKAESAWIRFYKTGEIEYKAERYDMAIQYFIKLADYTPEDIRPIKMLVQINQKIGNQEESTKYLVKIAEANQEDIPSRVQLGNYYFGKKDYENAHKYWSQIIKIDPSRTDIEFNIGVIYLQKQEYEKGKNLFASIIEKEPENTDAYSNGAMAAFQAKDFKLAAKWYVKLLSFPEFAQDYDIMTNVCYSYFSAKDWENTIKYSIKWFEMDKTKSDPVYLILDSAKQEHGNRPKLSKEYMQILNKLEQ